MSGDHNMNQTTSGWRKRQIALDKKAENARELGLDYEPNKTVIELARDCGINFHQAKWPELERFAALVRADEREAIAQMFEGAPALVQFAQNDQGGCLICGFTPKLVIETIRARGDNK